MISAKTKDAVSKYSAYTCLKAFRLNQEGNGASTIATLLGLTTNQADAAINAGRDIVNNDKTVVDELF